MRTSELSSDQAPAQTAHRHVLQRVNSAFEILALADGRLQDRLLLARQHLDAALAARDGWPTTMYMRARQVAQELNDNRQWIKRGGGRTITGLAESLAQQMLELAIDLKAYQRSNAAKVNPAAGAPGA